MRKLLRLAIAGALLGCALSSAKADDRFRRYFDSRNSCGVIGYCKTTASDILLRGPTAGRNTPRPGLEDLNRYNRSGRNYWRNEYVPRGAFPKMYVDVKPGDTRVWVPPPGANRAMRLSPAHVRWCGQRYRSYRRADNSFQPYAGARRACASPFG